MYIHVNDYFGFVLGLLLVAGGIASFAHIYIKKRPKLDYLNSALTIVWAMCWALSAIGVRSMRYVFLSAILAWIGLMVARKIYLEIRLKLNAEGKRGVV